jgi:hypothetical protein
VTEPPEPRHPEEGGGDDDFLGELDDDMTLDELGRGGASEGELGDMLGAWRDDVESAPVGPIAENAQEIHELNQQFKLPEARPDTGGSTGMSLQESIGILHGVAGNTAAAGPLNEASQTLSNTVLAAVQQAVEALAPLVGEAANATEGNAQLASEIQGSGEHAATAIEEAIDLVNSAIQTLDRALEHEQVFRQTCGDAGNRLAGG